MTRSIASLPHAAVLLDQLAGRRVAVFLDYDGTLSEIVAHPDDAVLDDDTRAAVVRLAGATPTAIVSGRDTEDVRRRVKVDRVVYAGSHGFHIRRADGSVIDDSRGKPFLPALDAAQSALEAALADVPGVQVERKRYAIAVHFRRAADRDVPRVEAAVDAVLAEQPLLRKGYGKKVFELRPDIDWHKGQAVLHLLAMMDDADELLPIYLGDDVTDEDAFVALHGRGVGVVVRGSEDRETAADYVLDDPADVRRFLEQLADLVEESEVPRQT